LKKRDSEPMIRPKLVKPRGILHLRVPERPAGYARFWPDDVLAPFVEHHWTVEWDVAEPEVRQVLTHPSVQLVLESGPAGFAAQLGGVHRRLFTRRFESTGRVLGTKFLPGGFRPFFGRAVSELTDRMVALEEVFGPDARSLAAEALGERNPVAAFGVVQSFLVRRLPERDPTVELVRRIADRVATDREITRVAQIAEAFGLGPRSLQRLFDDYVGVSPKWMIQRYRLHEAAERIAAGAVGHWADLALELGYADQAHFIRDFRRMVGRSPADYARAL
jgi:AraC-like DNA-binding protein